MTNDRNNQPKKRAPGGGAKPRYGVRKVTLAIRVTEAVKWFLKRNGNASEAVEQMVRNDAEFKAIDENANQPNPAKPRLPQ